MVDATPQRRSKRRGMFVKSAIFFSLLNDFFLKNNDNEQKK
jgi:hypothetical protein